MRPACCELLRSMVSVSEACTAGGMRGAPPRSAMANNAIRLRVRWDKEGLGMRMTSFLTGPA